jgi:hypothetical protein
MVLDLWLENKAERLSPLGGGVALMARDQWFAFKAVRPRPLGEGVAL